MLFRPLETSDLPEVDHWFLEPQTRRWLGGPGWASESLALVGPRRHVLLGREDGRPAALLDCEIYSDQRASFAIVIDPILRRQGKAAKVIEHLKSTFTVVQEFFAGIEKGNDASLALALSAGFRRMSDEDPDGFTYYAWRRDGDYARSWFLPGA